MIRLKVTAFWIQQYIIHWCLFGFSIKEVNITNVALGHLLLEAIGKKLGNKEVLFNFSNKSRIWDFSDIVIKLC